MLSIAGANIHFITDEGPFVFEFASDAEARSALDQWFVQHGCTNESLDGSE